MGAFSLIFVTEIFKQQLHHGPVEQQGTTRVPAARGAEADEGLYAVIPELGFQVLRGLR